MASRFSAINSKPTSDNKRRALPTNQNQHTQFRTGNTASTIGTTISIPTNGIEVRVSEKTISWINRLESRGPLTLQQIKDFAKASGHGLGEQTIRKHLSKEKFWRHGDGVRCHDNWDEVARCIHGDIFFPLRSHAQHRLTTHAERIEGRSRQPGRSGARRGVVAVVDGGADVEGGSGVEGGASAAGGPDIAKENNVENDAIVLAAPAKAQKSISTSIKAQPEPASGSRSDTSDTISVSPDSSPRAYRSGPFEIVFQLEARAMVKRPRAHDRVRQVPEVPEVHEGSGVPGVPGAHEVAQAAEMPDLLQGEPTPEEAELWAILEAEVVAGLVGEVPPILEDSDDPATKEVIPLPLPDPFNDLGLPAIFTSEDATRTITRCQNEGRSFSELKVLRYEGEGHCPAVPALQSESFSSRTQEQLIGRLSLAASLDMK